MTNVDTQRPDERVLTNDELNRVLRGSLHADSFASRHANLSTVMSHISALEAERDAALARAERAEADRDDIAASYSRVLMYITDGALSMPSTEPQMAIAMADDLDTKRWNEEMSEYEARAERAEQREARLREALAALAESAWTMQREFPADSYGADTLSTQVQEDVKRARAALATDEGAANV